MTSQAVFTPDERLAALEKPAMRAIDSLALTADDTLVICAGFEDRALAALAHALKESESFNVICVGYIPHLANNHGDAIRSMLEMRPGIKVTFCDYNRESPSGFGLALVESVGRRPGRVYLDISGMSRLLIVQVLVAFGSRSEGLKGCTVVYSEAADYPPSKAEADAVLRQASTDPTFSALFLSSGVFEITIVPELSSTSPAPNQSRLIVFPSFDVHHLIALRAELQPSRITFIEGIPPSSHNCWRQATIAALNHLDSIPEAERIATSTLRYEETLDALLRLYRQHGLRERLLIAPTGSKMQTVAVGLFRTHVKDAQIVYSTPRGFVSPDNYTHGSGPTHELPLDCFG
jgi:hypothetical protein